MKKIISVVLTTIILFISSCSIQSVNMENTTNSNVKATSKNYVEVNKLSNLFGFTNETGKLIISIETDEMKKDIDSVNKAIGENGNILSIKYVKSQLRNDNDNGRQTYGNFDNLEGDIFEVVEGKANIDETYYLVSDKEFNIRSILASQDGDQTEIDDESKIEIERTKNRKIQSSWEIGKINSDIKIYLILFERQNDDMLASIIMKTTSKIAYIDYPAKYDEGSTWRAEDCGEIAPWMFSILFAAKAEDGIIIGIKWFAPEGESTYLLKENGNVLEELDIGTGRYMVPI
jgi:predicted RND superfamily exporter protein